jgi:hypothetical protein
MGARLKYRKRSTKARSPLNTLKIRFLAVLFPVLLVAACMSVLGGEPEPDSAVSDEIIDRYVRAAQASPPSARSASMEVDINASIPKLKENGRLHAMRVISQVGRITYRVLGFQGSNTVKTQVIARYLQAEQQSQANPRLAITPINYKFKMKGVYRTDSGTDVYVFAVAPRKSGPGLFKGEIWLDATRYLPVYEKGRLVRNPSIFFKKVDFERAFSIQDGVSVPQYMNSTITTRLVGKVELDVNYSNYAQTAGTDDGGSAVSTVNFSSR